MNLYNTPIPDILTKYNTSTDGLSDQQASDRIKEYGENTLDEQKDKNWFLIFLSQFKDLLVVILAIAALISIWSDSLSSAVVIFIVLLLNAIIGTIQHIKARKSLKALKTLSSPSVAVLRNGVAINIASKDIAIGDIALIEAGDLIVADGRIIENHSLKVNESPITGESESVIKTDKIIQQKDLPLSDQTNMIFSGSFATYGRATAVITSTGMDTQLGKIASLMNKTKQTRTPLQKNLDSFSKTLAISITIICFLVFLLEWLVNSGKVVDALMFAVALAVAAIPEALSSIITIVQAMGTQRMVKEHAIIKDLKAVETLGSVNVICSDKTGTLTQNKMTAYNIYSDNIIKSADEMDLGLETDQMLLNIAVLTNDSIVDANSFIGDPTEVALVNLANSYKIEETDIRKEIPRIDEIPFDSERKLMSTVHIINGKRLLLTKGALDSILPKTKYFFTNDGEKNLSENEYKKIAKTNNLLSDEGLRVLAFAYKPIDDNAELTQELEKDFVFVGLISMMDPPRYESKKAVHDAKMAGIKTIMITGDQKTTATAIAKKLGIFSEGDKVISAIELNKMSDSELFDNIENITVYARVSPKDKIKIVNCWQKKQAIVAMTGDGVNDAPALKKADIGVSMGITGTEVAKDASSMILTDDNFATIIKAVQNGRNVYENIKYSIRFLLSGNMAGILVVLFTVLIPKLTLPFTAVQLLFINLLTDSLPALAIGMENSKEDLLKRPPRNVNQSILDKNALISIGVQGLLISIFTLIGYFYGFSKSPGYACTFAFSILALSRLFHGFNCRSSKNIFKLGVFSNMYIIFAFVIGVVLLSIVLFLPFFNSIFSVSPVSLLESILILALSFIPTLIIQTYKIIRDSKQK